MFNEYKEEIKLEKARIVHSLQEWDDPPTFTVVREIELFQGRYLKAQIQKFLKHMIANSYNYIRLW